MVWTPSQGGGDAIIDVLVDNTSDTETRDVAFGSQADTGDGYSIHSDLVSYPCRSTLPISSLQDENCITDLDYTETGGIVFRSQADTEGGYSAYFGPVSFASYPTLCPISHLPRATIGLWILTVRIPGKSFLYRKRLRKMDATCTPNSYILFITQPSPSHVSAGRESGCEFR